MVWSTYVVSQAAFAFLYGTIQYPSSLGTASMQSYAGSISLCFFVKSNQCVTVTGEGKGGLCTLRKQDTVGCTSGLRSVWNNSWNALKYTAWRSANSSFLQVSVPETNTCLTTKIFWQLYYVTNQFIRTCEDHTDTQDWLGRSGKKNKNKRRDFDTSLLLHFMATTDIDINYILSSHINCVLSLARQ